ncbi:MAG TPA: hypothetical protein VH951_14635 [Dehalococcoidia bacterium]|jgi:hypothetical protein
MPVSKPNRRWSRRRREQERKRVSPRPRGPLGGDLIDDGTSVFDPIAGAQRLGRFEGAMLARAIRDGSRGQSAGSILVWFMLGAALAGVGVGMMVELESQGATLGFGSLTAVGFMSAGVWAMFAQVQNAIRLNRRRHRR